MKEANIQKENIQRMKKISAYNSKGAKSLSTEEAAVEATSNYVPSSHSPRLLRCYQNSSFVQRLKSYVLERSLGPSPTPGQKRRQLQIYQEIPFLCTDWLRKGNVPHSWTMGVQGQFKEEIELTHCDWQGGKTKETGS